jgi:hypothetical protein
VSTQIIVRIGKAALTYSTIFIVSIVIVIGVSVPISRSLTPSNMLSVEIPVSITIDNVNLITMAQSGLLTDQQLVIEHGRIAKINPAGTPTDPESQLFDAQGGYLTPGLFDMHVHLDDRKYLLANLAFGVTSVRAMRGESRFLLWKKELQNRGWLGSNLYVSSPILDGKDAHALNQKTLTVEEGRHQVRMAKNKGYDLVKAYGYLEAHVFSAIVDEAQKLDIPVAKHGPHPIGNSAWQDLHVLQSLEHVEDIFQGPLNYKFDYQKLKEVVAQLKQLDVPVTPTLATFNHLTQLSKHKQEFVDSLDLDYFNPFYRDLQKEFAVKRWLTASKKHADYNEKELSFLQDIVWELKSQNVTMLIGSDAGTMFSLPGISTHDEIQLLKQAGLSELELLRAATINAASALNVKRDFGSIEVGKVADLILVEGNPLEDIGLLKNPKSVVKQGQWLSKTSLAKLKSSAKRHPAYYWSFIAFIDDILTRAAN